MWRRQLSSHSDSSGLPDYVYDVGERQPRASQKRSKVDVCPFVTTGFTASKAPGGKSNNTSPDMPNKKIRTSVVFTESSVSSSIQRQTSRSSHSASELALKPHENGVSPIGLTSVMDASGYATKDQMNTPPLQFGENMVMAAGAQ